MPIAFSLLMRIARTALDNAKRAAEAIHLSLDTPEKYAEVWNYAKGTRRLLEEKSMLADRPEYEWLRNGWGAKAFGALLNFDMRKSSLLATELSARSTYLVMHTFMATSLAVIKESGGIIVGLRGDGALALFGLVDQSDGNPKVTGDQAEHAVTEACDCGDAIVTAVQRVVNPILETEKIRKGREYVGVGAAAILVGVGIDVGDIVATRIGLEDANELTAYGIPVNHCCKRSFGNDEVILTLKARRMFPKSEGGKTKFPKHPGRDDSYILRYPDTYKTVA